MIFYVCCDTGEVSEVPYLAGCNHDRCTGCKSHKLPDNLTLKFSRSIGYWVDGSYGFLKSNGYHSTPEEAIEAAKGD